MGVEENLQAYRAILRAINTRDWDQAFAWLDPSVVRYIMGTPERADQGLAVIREGFLTFASKYPDARWELRRLFGQGDWVCAEFVFTGTHQEKNARVDVPMCEVLRFDNEKIVEYHVYFDSDLWASQLRPKAGEE